MSIVILPSTRWAAGQNAGEGRAFERIFKRSLDLTASSLGLIILLPICLAIAAAVLIDSRGPVLYSQVRVGINRHFYTRVHAHADILVFQIEAVGIRV